MILYFFSVYEMKISVFPTGQTSSYSFLNMFWLGTSSAATEVQIFQCCCFTEVFYRLCSPAELSFCLHACVTELMYYPFIQSALCLQRSSEVVVIRFVYERLSVWWRSERNYTERNWHARPDEPGTFTFHFCLFRDDAQLFQL